MQRFDLAILGCGPAGEKAAAQAAYYGKSVVVIDPGPIGGACVHTGTLPSKSLREAALVLSGARALDLRAVQVCVDAGARLADLLAHKAAVCAAEQRRMEANLARHGVRTLLGRGELAGAERVVVHPSGGGADVELSADVILIATGTHPHRPPELDFGHRRVWDSDEVVAMDELPRRLLVFGAGVIGCEYASIFGALGTEVVLVEPRDRVLPFVDEAAVEVLLQALAQRGGQVRTGLRLGAVVADDAGVEVTLLGASDASHRLRVDQVLYAAGRSGNTAGLGLEAVGLVADKRGLLRVDADYHTGVGRIYAVGDVIGFPALASTSMEQGRVAVCRAFGFPYKQRVTELLPYGIYTIPEISLVGQTCAALRAAGRPCEVGLARYSNNARAHLQGEREGFLQLTFDPASRRILGVCVVGHQASELVHVGMVAMQLGATLDTFVDAVFNFPTLGELYKYAAYDGLGRLALAGAAVAVAGEGGVDVG